MDETTVGEPSDRGEYNKAVLSVKYQIQEKQL